MVETFSFKSATTGSKVLFLGAIHGNEPCGTIAMQQLVKKFSEGLISLKQGSVTFVPISNPRAFENKVRFCEENLNRIFKRTINPRSYEARLANKLCNIIDEHDVIIDLHSSFAPGPTHAFVDYPTPENLALARILQPSFLLFDWPKVYENNPYSFPSRTTDRYAYETRKTGIVMECGQHEEPNAVLIAKESMLRALTYYQMVIPIITSGIGTEAIHVYMKSIYQKQSSDDHFPQQWNHFERVKQGEVMAIRQSGAVIQAPSDGYILFPKEYAGVGDEWFYFGQENTDVL